MLKGIIFTPDHATAIMAGRKTETRRVISPQPVFAQFHCHKGKEIYDGANQMNQLQQYIIALDSLLSHEAKWTKGVHAMDAAQVVVRPDDPKATCFCLVGACYPATGSKYGQQLTHRFIDLQNSIRDACCDGVAAFNDSPTTDFQKVKDAIGTARANAGCPREEKP